ncbi:MAG: Ohr family peroxiredoxin [Fulvivirga sp.]
MKPLYTAEITAQGDGRKGAVKSQDGNLNVRLAVPDEMGGDGAAGANPEQLFAAGYGSSFLDTLIKLADSRQEELKEPKVIVKVSIHDDNETGYHLSIALNVVEEALREDLLSALVKKSHQLCPYSKAISSNVEILLTSNKFEVT